MRRRVTFSVSALAMLANAGTPASAQSPEKPGSAYVHCDGQPDNVTGAETAARFLGAVTLLGLFAPAHETADATKRKLGEAGVAACNAVLTGDHPETDARRRFGLILGRAIHKIEAKRYDAAIADVEMARREAQAAGLLADPYFKRSRGRALNAIDAAALLRLGKNEDARAASLRDIDDEQYSLVPLISTSTYSDYLHQTSLAEEKIAGWRSRLMPIAGSAQADRLELDGRFADAARVRDAIVDFDEVQSPELNSSLFLAQSAVSHALANDFVLAGNRAAAARANAEKRREDGKPELSEAELVELLDLYNIIESVHADKVKDARRLFAARSQWVSASLGSVIEVNRRLRQGASADELIGGLSQTPDELWQTKSAAKLATLLAKDNDNKTLFGMVPGELTAKAYQGLSKEVWRTSNSRIMLKTKADPAKSPMELLFLPAASPLIALEAYVLHAALITKWRGQQGFVFMPIISDKFIAGSFRSGSRGQKGFPDAFFLDANDVIAKLAPIIPQPTS